MEITPTDYKTLLQLSVDTIVQVAKRIEDKITQLELKEKQLEDAKKEMETYTQAAKSKIVLDIGGKKFTTLKQTILKFSNSILGNMLTCGVQPGEDGSYFIDRNPKYFAVVLDYMRDGNIEVLNEYTQLEQDKIKKEFVYYGIAPSVPVVLVSSVPTPYIYEFADHDKQVCITQAHVLNKGTLLHNGKHVWRVRINAISPGLGTDVGVVSPDHSQNTTGGQHFNLGSKTAWGIRCNDGKAYYAGVKCCEPLKVGDIIKFELDLAEGSLQYTINDKKSLFQHSDVVGPVHIAIAGAVGSQVTIID